MSTNFDDVVAFQKKFGVPLRETPGFPEPELMDLKLEHIAEELMEFLAALHDDDLVGAFDALIDVVYVLLGLAAIMGLPWQPGWDAVHRANMLKERAERAEDSKRNSSYDVIKPEGWTPPDLKSILEAALKSPGRGGA